MKLWLFFIAQLKKQFFHETFPDSLKDGLSLFISYFSQSIYHILLCVTNECQ